MDTLRDDVAERARDPFRGLYISEADVDGLLADSRRRRSRTSSSATPAALEAPRLQRLIRAAGLSPFEAEVLLVCLAPEIDLRYERLYGYLQDDVTQGAPRST